jgi:hypothetical protein
MFRFVGKWKKEEEDRVSGKDQRIFKKRKLKSKGKQTEK